MTSHNTEKKHNFLNSYPLHIFNSKSCILMHSLAPKMGTTSVLSRPLCIGGNENCWKRLPNEARRAENRGRRPRAGWGS